MFANIRLLLVASILCCFWQHIDASGFFKKEFNFDEVDAVLRADGMRADGSASETKKHIENFVPPKDSNIKREMEFLRQLCIFEFRHCRKKLKDTMKSVGSIQENSKLSTALRVFAKDRRAKIIATCMQEIENNSETDLSRGMSHRLSKLKKLRGEDDLDYYDLLGVVKSGSYYDEIDDMLPRIDRVIAIINNNYKLVSRRMENLGINSYSMDELSGQEAKNAYALYLVRRKINKMDSDMREFVKSRSELHRTLLNNIVSNSNTSRNRRFYFNNIKALARREMSKPNIISKLGVAGSDKVQIREALEGLLSEACGSDRMSEFYQLVALDIWDDKLPMSRHAKNMAAMCYWSRCVPPGIRDRPQNLMTKLDDLMDQRPRTSSVGHKAGARCGRQVVGFGLWTVTLTNLHQVRGQLTFGSSGLQLFLGDSTIASRLLESMSALQSLSDRCYFARLNLCLFIAKVNYRNMNLVHFLVVVATIGLVAFAGHSEANDWIVGDILEADRSLQKLNICSTSTNAEILKKITKWIGRSKENQIPRVIVDLNRLRLSDDCMSLNVALDYNDMIQSNQHKVSRCLRSYAEAAAAEFTSRCAEKLSRDNWSQFEYAMEWRMHGDHTDLIDEIMADQFAGSESFDDLNLYQRFANGIRSVANKRHVLIQQLTEPIGKLCFWSRILFKNMANSDPKGRLTTRIKNLYIAQRLWSDMLQARDKKFVSLVEKFDPADRRLLSEAAQGSAVNFGVRMMASDHQISEEEARTKLRSLCRSIDARDLAIIKFIEHMRLWTGRDEYSFAVASFCAQLNFPGSD